MESSLVSCVLTSLHHYLNRIVDYYLSTHGAPQLQRNNQQNKTRNRKINTRSILNSSGLGETWISDAETSQSTEYNIQTRTQKWLKNSCAISEIASNEYTSDSGFETTLNITHDISLSDSKTYGSLHSNTDILDSG